MGMLGRREWELLPPSTWLCRTSQNRAQTRVSKGIHHTRKKIYELTYHPLEMLATSVPWMGAPKTRRACRYVKSLPWLPSMKIVTVAGV
jgi:hypothetical protein